MQLRGKSIVSLVNSHTNATRIGWHQWEIDLRFALNSTPGWSVCEAGQEHDAMFVFFSTCFCTVISSHPSHTARVGWAVLVKGGHHARVWPDARAPPLSTTPDAMPPPNAAVLELGLGEKAGARVPRHAPSPSRASALAGERGNPAWLSDASLAWLPGWRHSVTPRRQQPEPRLAPCRRRTGGAGGQRGSFFFFFTLVTGPRRSLSLKLGDTRVYEPQIRARLGTTVLW